QWCKWVARSSSSFVGEISTSVLGALDVGAVRRHDHDLRPRADEGRNHGAHAVRQQRGLVGGGGSLPFHRRLGLHHLQGGLLGKLDRDRHPLVDGEHDLHLRLEVGGLVTDDVGGQRHLVVGLGVHEMKAVAVLVEVLMRAILHVGAFDLLGRLEALRHFYAVADAAHVDLSGGGTLAGMEAFGIEDDIELAVEFDDIALAERAGDDFHGEFSSITGRARPILGPNVAPHHTDLAVDRQCFSGRWTVETALEGAPLMPPPFWALHAGRRPFLLGRMRMAAALRQFFAARDFVEVETAALVPSPGNETHLHAFATDLTAPAGTRTRLYLRTSPEFACKKLLTAGERRIVEFARSFRNRERGVLHHPEFTMLEWYRAQEPYEVLMEDCAAILALAAKATGSKRFSFRGRAIDPF